MTFTEIAAIGSTVMFNASAQILLRAGLRNVDIGTLLAQHQTVTLVTSVVNIKVLGGLTCYVFSVLTWMYVLSRLPVGLVYPMMSLAFAAALIMGWTFLGEEIRPARLAGIAFIAVGIWVVTRGA